MKHLNQETILQKKYGPPSRTETINTYLSDNLRNALFQRFCLGLLLCFGLFTNISAQETWNGSVDGNWEAHANWADGSAPVAGSISGDGILTIGLAAANAPTTNIPPTITAKQLIVSSPFTIPVGTTATIDGAPGDGVVTNNTGNLTVLGTLNVVNSTQNGLNLGTDNTGLLNLGTVAINNSGNSGVVLTGTGSSVNGGNLTINASGADGITGIGTGSFDNQTSACLTILNSTNNGIVNIVQFTNSAKIIIDTVDSFNGILNTATGVFTNDSLGTLTITNIAQDGINSAGTFENDGGIITIGDGSTSGIGDNGIDIASGAIFNNHSTVAQGGGTIKINGVNGDGIALEGTLTNGSTAVGDSLGIITIDTIGGDGINVNSASLMNQEASQFLVGFNGGGVAGTGLIGSGLYTNTESIAKFNGTVGAFNFNGPIMHTGDCGVLEITGPSTFSGGSTNNAVIISSAPTNSVTVGAIFTNNGIIIDPNNSFESDLAGRAAPTDLLNNGVIVAPLSAMCFTDTIENFLITNLPTPITFPYLPNTTFSMGTNPNAATLDILTNRLILHEVQSLMDFTFDINLNGNSCGATGSTSLTFDNLPNTFLACVGSLQVTLINDCRAVFKPEDLLATSIVCSDGYQIGLIGGTMGDSLIIDAASIGETLSVMVTNPLGNSCWTTLNIEDKTAPICEFVKDTTYFCGTIPDAATINAYPIVSDACSAIVDTIISDEYLNFSACGGNPADVDTIKQVIRTWTFIDTYGNSTSCVQNLYELKPTLSMVQFPSDLTGAKALGCGTSHEGRTGYPFVVVNGDTILVNQVCKFGLDTLDNTIEINCPGKQRVSRIWYVTDWCALGSGTPVRSMEQFIDITDTIAPRITVAGTATVSSNADHNCTANVTLTPVTFDDNCSDVADMSVTIIGPSNTIFTNGGVMSNVPFGTHNIIYIVADGCGNETRDTVSVTVNDLLPPVAIGQEVAITLIDADVVTWVYASSFDGGSHDNCSIDSFLVRKSRVDTFANKIAFNCFDLGLDTVVIRVVDTAGNVSTSWALARVEDKQNFCTHDNDTAPTRWEDLDNDGDPTNDFTIPGAAVPDYLNPDDDGDGVPTEFENPDPNGDGDISDAQDTDGDGIPDFRDVDDDGDGIWTIYEGALLNEDNDEDPRDTNKDGIPDYLDEDDDGDSVYTIFEGANPVDGKPTNPQNTDLNLLGGDAIPDYLDDNDDGDAIATRFEAPDADGNGNPDDAKDRNNNGIADYLDSTEGLSSSATIEGHIQNENGELVEGANISIGGYEMAPATTGANGTFTFEEIPLEGDYMITPEKDMNYGNGVSTFDIVLLSKHILGLRPLDSPYKMIAADINHSGTISAFDMVLLRQVILGVKNDFPNNTSWKFIDAAYEFYNPENPFLENYPEAHEITSLAGDMMTLDFTAVKIGDLNNSASTNQLMSSESRNTNQSLNFQVAEQVKKAGEIITVDFKSSNFKSILGYQFTFNFDGNALGFEQILIGDKAGFENFNLSMVQRGIITTSWNQSEAVNLEEEEVLFSLVFKAKENIRLSEVIQIGSDITSAEAYTETEEVINVNLDIHNSIPMVEGFKLYQNKPNPFTGETIIGFDLPKAMTTTMTILDMSGKVVQVIKGDYEKGYNQILIDGKALNDHGMFYYQLATANGIETKKMILLKQ